MHIQKKQKKKARISEIKLNPLSGEARAEFFFYFREKNQIKLRYSTVHKKEEIFFLTVLRVLLFYSKNIVQFFGSNLKNFSEFEFEFEFMVLSCVLHICSSCATAAATAAVTLPNRFILFASVMCCVKLLQINFPFCANFSLEKRHTQSLILAKNNI